jgi:para-aminobenzoate synthetase/4-amino-4-deoxychorismate lyase
VSGAPEIILESFAGGASGSRRFSGLEEVITSPDIAGVIPALEKVESLVAKGYHAAGFVSYEAAPGLQSTLRTRPRGDFPLIWFGIYRECLKDSGTTELIFPGNPAYEISETGYSLSPAAYHSAIARIRQYIAAGDTYQVNFTMRRRFTFSGDEKSFYCDLCRSQRAQYCAFLDLGRYSILSASPELFFSIKDGILTTRPMKGTANRGRWTAEDEDIVRRFRADEKERAENLMIVDLLRNDMGMVSETGSVRVASLFDVETLETVHQMTSTITSRVSPDTGIAALFRALFPCGSVTGAPKRRTMEIIAELEDSPRNLYTGCIGYISPGPEAAFSVAIRTAVIDRESGTGEMGLGSGVTWDSDPDREYEECLAKGRFARIRVPEFRLLESLLFEEGTGYFLLERHLQRLSNSAAYFRFRLDLSAARQILLESSLALRGACKVRLQLARNGSLDITSEPIQETAGEGHVKIEFAENRVDSANHFLYHKTDNRAFYTVEAAKRPDCTDVIFVNERDEVTEGANNNIVARINGELITPPLDSGLLPGVFREELLDKGIIREQVLDRRDLEGTEEIYLINSVRKWRKAVFK